MLKRENHKEELEKHGETNQKNNKEVAMHDCLIWLRDNVVHGNENHVKAINRALGE